MMARWMLQSATIGILVALAAWGAESALRVAGRQLRWIWIGALLLTVGLSALTPWRHSGDTAIAVLRDAAWTDDHAIARIEVSGFSSMLSDALNAARRTVETAVDWTSAPTRALWNSVYRTSVQTDAWLAVSWLLLALGVAIVLTIVYAVFARSLRMWPVAYLQGRRVRVSSLVGPAVMGVTRAEIIVPQWLLSRDPLEQRLVLDHESEHLRARDPLLLAASCAMAVALPWHPAVWWMLARLRLAVELDCDRRLLRRGINKRAYGNLLIELTGHRPGLRFASPAFACSTSHLERRLLDMTASRPRYRTARIAVVGALSLFGILVACEANLPTAAQMKDLDVASAEKQAGKVALYDTMDVAYAIDDVPATKEAARAMSALDIGSIAVLKATHGEPGRVRILTRKYAAAKFLSPRADTAQDVGIAYMTEGSGDSAITVHKRPLRASVRIRPSGDLRAKQAFGGLLLVNGTIVDATALDRIAQDDIESVEVVKGNAATLKFSDPRAANGVILLKTTLRKTRLEQALMQRKGHLDQQPVPQSSRK